MVDLIEDWKGVLISPIVVQRQLPLPCEYCWLFEKALTGTLLGCAFSPHLPPTAPPSFSTFSRILPLLCSLRCTFLTGMRYLCPPSLLPPPSSPARSIFLHLLSYSLFSLSYTRDPEHVPTFIMIKVRLGFTGGISAFKDVQVDVFVLYG